MGRFMGIYGATYSQTLCEKSSIRIETRSLFRRGRPLPAGEQVWLKELDLPFHDEPESPGHGSGVVTGFLTFRG